MSRMTLKSPGPPPGLASVPGGRGCGPGKPKTPNPRHTSRVSRPTEPKTAQLTDALYCTGFHPLTNWRQRDRLPLRPAGACRI